MIWILVGVAVVALVTVWIVVVRQPHQEPGVVSFRKHIDALSPEARREVMDRVRPPDDDAAADAAAPDDDNDDDERPEG